MINPRYQIDLHQKMKFINFEMREYDFGQIFIYDELRNRWLAPIKILTEETFLLAKRVGVAVVKVACTFDKQEWFFDTQFVLDHGNQNEKANMLNLISILNLKKITGKLKRM